MRALVSEEAMSLRRDEDGAEMANYMRNGGCWSGRW